VTSEEQDVSLLIIYLTSQPSPATQNFQDLEIFNDGDELRAKSRRRYSKMQDKKVHDKNIRGEEDEEEDDKNEKFHASRFSLSISISSQDHGEEAQRKYQV
jgi:hypothetical protein